MSASKLFFVFLVLLIFLVPIFTPESSASDSDSDNSAIDQTEVFLASVYEVVLEAEQLGANVSGLLARLNVAGEYSANAHIWYDLGDFENATRFANLCYDVGEEVRNEAYELKNEAYGSWVTSLFVKMTVSLVSVVIVVLLSFAVWRVFKRRYHKRILGMKPEVVSSES